MSASGASEADMEAQAFSNHSHEYQQCSSTSQPRVPTPVSDSEHEAVASPDPHLNIDPLASLSTGPSQLDHGRSASSELNASTPDLVDRSSLRDAVAEVRVMRVAPAHYNLTLAAHVSGPAYPCMHQLKAKHRGA